MRGHSEDRAGRAATDAAEARAEQDCADVSPTAGPLAAVELPDEYAPGRTSAIRVPPRLRALQARVFEAVVDVERCSGRSARPSEIARRLGVDLEVVIEALAAHARGGVRP